VSAPRFFVPGVAADIGVEIALPDGVAHHATRVLRLAAGAPLVLFGGDGGEYAATLSKIDKRGATVRIERFDPVERESPLALTLVMAIIAADPMDVAVRKAVELGAIAIAPVIAARSQRIAGAAKTDKRLLHWQQIAIAGCEQCGRNRVPVVEPPAPFGQWLASRDPSAGAVMLVPGAASSLPVVARTLRLRHVLVGPEGGFTDDEVAQALANGIQAAHLGPRVLRAETAAIAALATLNAAAGDCA